MNIDEIESYLRKQAKDLGIIDIDHDWVSGLPSWISMIFAELRAREDAKAFMPEEAQNA